MANVLGIFYLLLIFIVFCDNGLAFSVDDDGEDSADFLTCPRPQKVNRRTARFFKMQEKVLKSVPCEMGKDNWWCGVPGEGYPWGSLRRFISENTGLLRRMYGEVRQAKLLKMEFLETNTIDEFDDENSSGRHRHFEDNSEQVSQARMSTTDVMETAAESITTIGNISSSSEIFLTEATTVPMTTNDNGERDATTTPMTSGVEDDLPMTTTFVLPEENKTSGESIEQRNSGGTFFFDNMSSQSQQSQASSPFSQEVPAPEEPPIDFRPPPPPSPPKKMRVVNACPTKEEVVSPYWANNTRGEVLALLNLYPFEQYVHWEKCSYEHEQMFCRDGCSCTQQYRLHRLLAFDPTNECRGIFSDWFRFPSCCVCKCLLSEEEIFIKTSQPSSQKMSPSVTGSNYPNNNPNIRSPRKVKETSGFHAHSNFEDDGDDMFEDFTDFEQEDDPDVRGVFVNSRQREFERFYYGKKGSGSGGPRPRR